MEGRRNYEPPHTEDQRGEDQRLELAGVPVLLRPPADPHAPAPLIVLWHGFGPPGGEETLARTLPLEDVQAWKAYLGLPLFGSRLPCGGSEELLRRQMDDYVLRLLVPVAEQAMRELPEVVEALFARYTIDLTPGIGLFGFSAGGITAMLTLMEGRLPIRAAVLVGVPNDLDAAVSAFESQVQAAYPALKAQFPWVREEQTHYTWSEASDSARRRFDFVARAAEIAEELPAVLLIHGAQDEMYPSPEPLTDALRPHYERARAAHRLGLRVLPDLAHHIPPPEEAVTREQRQNVQSLQHKVATWLNHHLRITR